MARIYDRYGNPITAQASAAITAGNFSGGSQTVVDKTASGNADGAQRIDCHVNVTVAPSGGNATCEVWVEESGDGTNYSAAEYALSVEIPNGSTGYFHLGRLHLARKSKLKIKAVDYGFTASLLGTPEYTADA